MKSYTLEKGNDDLFAVISEGVQHALTKAGLDSGSMPPGNENELLYFSRQAINDWLLNSGRVISEQERKCLEKEKARYAYEANRIWHHYYEHMHTLSESFFTNLGNCCCEEKPPSNAVATGYFDMQLISVIYAECNNEQFEAIAAIDFYAVSTDSVPEIR
jgi:hypothetical protein